ncbi:bifunctional 4-hydroxy-2-oxoglutarate aldolase/2-dehydro-3-deoxy-phosphogluconate aldolase [Oscillospiraceae bacterium MB08-C2-2]|nr:bifunctional 4-hydroxy-2-oxoglutarate aldolase/2-dehydro-3-deoxy-phosphogluconate aldolase [Oscillospiraceae bacterium MB08-C2-2]
MNVLQKLLDGKIIAIVRGIPTSAICDTARALLAGGINAMEVTFDQRSKEGLAETAASIKAVKEQLGDEILLGAGTVMTPEQVQIAYDCGAKYIISPDTNTSVIKKTKELGMVSIPGAFTPSEIAVAYAAGADIVKLFPAGLMGPEYFKAVLAPLSHMPVSAVGGINENNAASFFKAGVCSVGVGGNLINAKAILAGDFSMTTQTAQKLVEAVKGL